MYQCGNLIGLVFFFANNTIVFLLLLTLFYYLTHLIDFIFGSNRFLFFQHDLLLFLFIFILLDFLCVFSFKLIVNLLFVVNLFFLFILLLDVFFLLFLLPIKLSIELFNDLSIFKHLHAVLEEFRQHLDL
jgi:hypothetical protein